MQSRLPPQLGGTHRLNLTRSKYLLAPDRTQLSGEVDLHGLARPGCSWRQTGKAPPSLDDLDRLSVFEPRRHSSEIIAKVSHCCGFDSHDRLIYHDVSSRQVEKAHSLQSTTTVSDTVRFWPEPSHESSDQRVTKVRAVCDSLMVAPCKSRCYLRRVRSAQIIASLISRAACPSSARGQCANRRS